MSFSLFIIVLAIVFLALEAFSVSPVWRIKWGWLGLTLLALVWAFGK